MGMGAPCQLGVLGCCYLCLGSLAGFFSGMEILSSPLSSLTLLPGSAFSLYSLARVSGSPFLLATCLLLSPPPFPRPLCFRCPHRAPRGPRLACARKDRRGPLSQSGKRSRGSHRIAGWRFSPPLRGGRKDSTDCNALRYSQNDAVR